MVYVINYQQHILSSNYQCIVSIWDSIRIILINCGKYYNAFVYRAELNTSDVAINLITACAWNSRQHLSILEL